MIRLNGITKYYNKNSANETIALNNIVLEIPASQFVILLGANGSGKTSLLNILAGSTIPDEGTIIIEEVNVTSWPDFERCRLISRIFQNPLAGTASSLSIVENFRLASLRTRVKGLKNGINAKFRQMVQQKIASLNLGLENKLDQPMGTLSGGQRQALTLLMSIMDDTKVILLDEPASALDPRTADLIMKLAKQLIVENKLTAVLVTHHLKDAIQYGDRIIQMAEGKIKRDISGSEKSKLHIGELYEWF